MQRLSFLAAGAAAMNSVILIENDDVWMGMAYWVDGDYLHFTADQEVLIDQEIQMAS